MTRLQTLLWISCLLVLGSFPVFANSMDSTSININVVHKAQDNIQMKITGSAFSNTSTHFSMMDLRQGKSIKLGTLGIQPQKRSMPARYDIAFKSANGFRLKNAEHSLAAYKINYDQENILLKTARLNSNESQTGIYQDNLTIVVTVQ